MNFPRHWARAAAPVVPAVGLSGDPVAAPREVACWRASDTSLEAAQAEARAAAERLAARIAAGEQFPERYLYGRGQPLREELIEVVARQDGEISAAVTRNGYGALVLNTASAAFVDVDLDLVSETAPPRRLGRTLFAVMFGAAAPTPGENAVAASPPKKLLDWIGADRRRGARVYRTAAGYRYLLTHEPFDPGSPETAATFEALGTDPLYLQLCRAQKSFRARLTAKPWRCGAGSLKVPWPVTDPQHAERVARELRAYESKAEGFAACSFVGAFGNDRVEPELEPIVRFHDERSGARSNRSLA